MNLTLLAAECPTTDWGATITSVAGMVFLGFLIWVLFR